MTFPLFSSLSTSSDLASLVDILQLFSLSGDLEFYCTQKTVKNTIKPDDAGILLSFPLCSGSR